MTSLENPTSVVAAAFAALCARDWPLLVTLVDPEALAALRVDELGAMIFMAEERLAGNMNGGGFNPEEFVTDAHLSRVGSERVPQFPGEPRIAELGGLKPEEFFLRWCTAAFDSTPLARPPRQVVAEILEGDELAHVLYRRERHQFGPDHRSFVTLAPGSLEIMPVKRRDNEWRLLLNRDIEQQVSYLRSTPRQKGTVSSGGPVIQAYPSVLSAVSPFGVTAGQQLIETMTQIHSSFSDGDWDGLAAHVDPEVLAEFQQDQLETLVGWDKRRAMLENPAMWSGVMHIVSIPSRVASMLISHDGDRSIQFGAGTRMVRDLAALSPVAFFSAWCKAAYGEPTGTPGMTRMAETRTIIGAATEGERRGHVLYRPSGNEYDRPWDLERMEMIWSGKRWGMKLNDDIGSGRELSIGAMMRGTQPEDPAQ